MSERFTSVDHRQLIDQVTPDTPHQVRMSRKRARRLREFVCAHLPENVDVEVVITPHISTAAVLPADIDAILGADATELDRAQAERLLTGIDADYLVLVTGNEAPLNRVPLNDQLTADHAHQFGLAFHELLPILKTAIVTIGRLLEEEIDPAYHEPVHDLINIIEDGAIEHEAVHGETFSDNAGIRLELTRRIHSMTPEDISDGQQVEFTFWDAVTSSLYDATIYPTGMTDCLLDPDDDRIGFKAEVDRNAFEAVQDDLKRLAVDALSISGNASGDATHEHGKYASIRRARRVIETWKTAIQPVLERQQAGLQERSDEAKLGGEPDSGEQDDDELQGQCDDSASGSDDESRSDLGEDGSPSDTASAGRTPEKGDHRPESGQGDLHPSEVTVERQATDIPYQDIFEQPAVTADPDVDDLSELEKEDSLGGGKTANSDVEPISDFVVPEVEGRSTGDEGIDPGTAGSQEAEDSPVDELPTQTQVLAEAIERTRTREHGGSSSSGDDRAGDGVDAEQPGSDGGPSSGDQLSLDEFDTDSTADRLDEESEGSELSETNSSTQHDAADDGTNSGSLKTASSETDSGGPSSEAESEPVGPAHARSPGRAPDEEQASYEDALDTDRRTAHDEAAREGIDRTAHEQELAELGRAIERERGQVVEVEGAGRENWYEIVIPWKNLYHVFKRSTYGSLVETTIGPTLDGDSLTEQNAFVGMVVIVDGDDAEACARDWAVPSEYVINESRLSSAQSDVAPVPSDYGNELPAPLLVGEYASGSQYPFLSWADGLVCSCPYKHDKPWRVLCKYELLAAVVAGGRDSIFLPVTRGIEVPHRARRFVSPEFVD